MKRAYVDLHSHYLPNIDDGVRTAAEGLSVLAGLAKLGFERVIATPHIRTAMFENRRPALERAFAELEALARDQADLPQLGLAAEHYCDDVFFSLFRSGEAVPYPGGHAALVELHYDVWPSRIEQRFFEMQLKRVRPVLAHPERYAALARATDPLDPLLDAGVLTLLDLMALVGKYGERTQRAAERMLDEGAYDAACSDIHRETDLPIVERSIARLVELVGAARAEAMLAVHPAEILAGRYEP